MLTDASRILMMLFLVSKEKQGRQPHAYVQPLSCPPDSLPLGSNTHRPISFRSGLYLSRPFGVYFSAP